jgi:two-component system phosphate regulon sensor histidine kinase PhoR
MTKKLKQSITRLTERTLNSDLEEILVPEKYKLIKELLPVEKAIKDLTGKHQILIRDNKFDREEFKLVLSSINEPLWIQNNLGQIIWASLGFTELFPGYTRGSNKYYWQIVRDALLLNKIKLAEAKPEQTLSEITLDDHFYLLKSNYNPKTDTTVFIMQNIDLLRQTEQMKKDFIINLAHELRTPLTAIKGFSEALTESVDPNSIRYLNIIRNHTDRLINLVSDLQVLSQIERLPELNLEYINLHTFFENIFALYQQEIEDKGLTLSLEADNEQMRLSVDPYKFEQIFINLIDNALRYTTTGGIVIKISKQTNSMHFEVCDTGTGIKPEHLPRIFERFYVADPSRNRSQGGTGLGLAIAKHSVLLHNGTIEVQSTPGTGTCFIMNFPLSDI